MQTTAYCWANGLIEFGNEVPDDALPIATADYDVLDEILGGCARLSYNGDFLVPGVPEADDDNVAVDAAVKFTREVKLRLESRD